LPSPAAKIAVYAIEASQKALYRISTLSVRSFAFFVATLDCNLSLRRKVMSLSVSTQNLQQAMEAIHLLAETPETSSRILTVNLQKFYPQN
jgi:hypothetical protein